MTTSNQKKTALYCRLSQDDNTENESNSIQNQENRRAITFYQREGLIITSEGLDENTGYHEYTMTWEGHFHSRFDQDTDLT